MNFLFVSNINLTIGMILLFYQNQNHGTIDAVQLQSQSQPYIYHWSQSALSIVDIHHTC